LEAESILLDNNQTYQNQFWSVEVEPSIHDVFSSKLIDAAALNEILDT